MINTMRKPKKINFIKASAIALGSSFVCFGLSLILIFGAPEHNCHGEKIEDDLSDKHIIKQYIVRTCRELDFYVKLIQVPLNEKLLPDPLDYPYLQPKYTLVLELTDVLVHLDCSYVGECKFKKRPLLDHFLQTLSDHYEIIIYTAEQGKVVFSITDVIDPKHIIAYKLVRGTTHFTGTNHVKKLNDLNRDLSKIICVDWNAKHLKYNPENLLCVKQWDGSDDDTSLLDLAMFLKTIAENGIEDVREVLQHYSKFEDPMAEFRKKQKKLIEELEEHAAAKKVDSQFKKLSKRFKLRRD
ncbi:hypothetical protein NQ318_008843 [Aromia moschata]|uniref:Mitochondrial import inner membrane translocase subunit TIM50 n=1 Tax=Aromia moschata TaxID=1265417 RepID=A0AAV8ZC41_9CUCU|nr:hypothetical protein NQ318_008843 [Aromia moschata]